jgi:hypothetical protein
MTKLGDKATETPEVQLVRQSAPGVYRLPDDGWSIEAIELVPADDLTAEGEFPQYGEFLELETTNGGADPTVDSIEFVECPEAFARWLVENGEPGEWFRIAQVRKVDGTWEYTIEEVEQEIGE